LCAPWFTLSWLTLSWLPTALGIAFNRDAHAIVMPNERVLTTAGGSPRWYKDAKTWASAVDEAMAAQAWFDAGQPTVGGEQ
jgi:hypothetical protein